MDVRNFRTLTYPFILPLFFLGSCLLYNPFDIKGYYADAPMDTSFHLVMISCIILVCSLISRFVLRLILKRRNYLLQDYMAFCAAELAVMSAFTALYTVLFKGPEGGYFSVLPDCSKFIFLTLVYPYIFLTLMHIIRIKDDQLAHRNDDTDNTLIRFYDEHKRLKLSISPSAILYVKSEFNYVNICYLDSGKVKHFLLRSSMKSLENLDNRALVRCQRSYFVNPEHISVLRKDKQGFIFAEMNNPDIEAVPVSKQYYDHLSSLL